MLVSPLDPFLRRWMAPALAPAGFTRVGSRRFHRVETNGDLSSVWVQKLTAVDDRVTVRIHLGVQPQLFRDAFHGNRCRQGPGPDTDRGLWHWTPGQGAMEQGDWQFSGADPVGRAALGEELQAAIVERWIPLMDHLIVPEHFESELRRPWWELPGSLSWGGDTLDIPLAVVIANQRQSDEVDQLLTKHYVRRWWWDYWVPIWERLGSGDYPHLSVPAPPPLPRDAAPDPDAFVGAVLLFRSSTIPTALSELAATRATLRSLSIDGGWMYVEAAGDDGDIDAPRLAGLVASETGQPTAVGVVPRPGELILTGVSSSSGTWTRRLRTRRPRERFDVLGRADHPGGLTAPEAGHRLAQWVNDTQQVPLTGAEKVSLTRGFSESTMLMLPEGPVTGTLLGLLWRRT